jgi:hypothetical protein
MVIRNSILTSVKIFRKLGCLEDIKINMHIIVNNVFDVIGIIFCGAFDEILHMKSDVLNLKGLQFVEIMIKKKYKSIKSCENALP